MNNTQPQTTPKKDEYNKPIVVDPKAPVAKPVDAPAAKPVTPDAKSNIA